MPSVSCNYKVPMKRSREKVLLFSFAAAALLAHVTWLPWPLSLLVHFPQHFLALSATGAAIAAFRGHTRLSSILLLCFLTHAMKLYPEFRDQPQRDQPRQIFKLVSYNVHLANKNYNEIAHYLLDEQPDFIGLQETGPAWEQTLQSMRASYPSQIFAHRHRFLGVALLSKHPCSSRRADFGPGGSPVLTVNCIIGRKKISVSTLHAIPPYFSGADKERHRYFDRIAKSQKKYRNTLISGDFNLTPFAPLFGQFLKSSGLQDSRRGFGLQTSWPTWLPFAGISIDHVFHSDSVVVINRKLGPDLGSDHYPVMVEFGLR